jgi:predicted dehydrogenase
VRSVPDVGIGIAGYGVMARAHAYAYTVAPHVRQLPVRPRLRLISGRDRGAVPRAASAYGVDDWTTDWQALFDRPDIEIVDICTPPGTHAELIEAAAAAGKAVLCEKPLAVDYPSAARAVAAAQAAGVPNAISFNYRRLPAVSLLKRMVDAGHVGDVLLLRARWLSDEFLDPEIPFDWRFERRLGGTTIADLGAHLIDLALWIVGDITEVVAQSSTFTPERSGRQVDVDEASSALVRFAGDQTGVFEFARTCARRPCDFEIEVNGTRGTLRFDYSRLNELWYGNAEEDSALYGFRRIRAEHRGHPYAGDWWPLGQGVGYGTSFVNQVADHLERFPDGPWEPDLETGLRVQRVCEALERAAAEHRWVRVDEVGA